MTASSGGGDPGGTGTEVVGAVVLLFVVSIFGGTLYFVSSIFKTVSGTTSDVTEQVGT